jgi:hypothetical protein
MINLKFSDNSIQLKHKWSEVTLYDYVVLQAINADSELSDLEKTISILTSLSTNENSMHDLLMSIDANNLNSIVEKMEITTTPLEQIQLPSEQKTEFEIDGKKYRIKEEFNSLSLETMVNIENILKNSPTSNPTLISFGVLIREVNEHGKLKAFTEKNYDFVVNELSKKIKLLDIYHYTVGFTNGVKTSISSTPAFSMEVL